MISPSFTPWTSLAGGVLIGAAATLLLWANGRIAGVSGIVGYALAVLAGLCVGIGTSYGGGCTSDHGVCGIARRSMRSLVATLTFIAAGIATVFVLRHLLDMGSPRETAARGRDQRHPLRLRARARGHDQSAEDRRLSRHLRRVAGMGVARLLDRVFAGTEGATPAHR